MKTRGLLLPLTQSPLFFLTTLLILLPNPTYTAAIDPPSASAFASASASSTTFPTKEDIEFIRKSCETTEYPKVCYKSLSPYAGSARQDPAKLARVAIAITLSKAKKTATYFSKYAEVADQGVVVAINDCVELFEEAVEDLRSSLNTMQHLAARSDERYKSQINDIEAWLSSLSMDEFICTEGIDEVKADELVRSDVHKRVHRVEELSSIALHLFTSFEDSNKM